MSLDDLGPMKARGAEIYRQYVELKPQPGGRLLGLCPFHGEKTPSFTVFADGGWKCFGCDLAGDVFAFVQQIDGCTFTEAKQRVGERLGFVQAHNGAQGKGRHLNAPAVQVAQDAEGEPRPVAWYRYVDEAGALLFEVVRFEPGRNGKRKDFRQRRPDGNGGWIPRLDDVRRPLYRLPSVLEHPSIFLVEGEKDVHTLEGLGFVATTNAGGSSQAWRDEWTEALRGKTVTIIPDKDEPGARHAAKVREALTGAASAVAVLELPGDCKDVSDWVAAGGTKDELRKLAADAVMRARAEALPWWERVGGLDDIDEAKEVEWVVEGLIPRGALVLIAGKPGAYKSFVALELARSIAEGRLFAGRFATEKTEVMYVDLENPQSIVALRKKKLQIGKLPNLRYLGRWSEMRFAGIESQEIRDYARAVKPVLIFDSLIRFHAADENDNSEMAGVMANFMAMTSAGATVIVLHHAAKSESKGSRGAIEIESSPDVSYVFNRLADSQVKVKGHKNRLGPEATVELELVTGGFRVVTEIGGDDDGANDLGWMA